MIVNEISLVIQNYIQKFLSFFFIVPLGTGLKEFLQFCIFLISFSYPCLHVFFLGLSVFISCSSYRKKKNHKHCCKETELKPKEDMAAGVKLGSSPSLSRLLMAQTVNVTDRPKLKDTWNGNGITSKKGICKHETVRQSNSFPIKSHFL